MINNSFLLNKFQYRYPTYKKELYNFAKFVTKYNYFGKHFFTTILIYKNNNILIFFTISNI